MLSPITTAYKAGAFAARYVPSELGERLACWLGVSLSYLMDSHREMVEQHQHRAIRWRTELENGTAAGTGTGGTSTAGTGTGGTSTAGTGTGGTSTANPADFVSLLDVRGSTKAAFESYVRYWLELFRLPALSHDVLDAGFDSTASTAYSSVRDLQSQGKGLILALPHLGGWEWAGFWLARVKQCPVTVVVEPLNPPELFEWFAGLRRSLGMNVVPIGPDAGSEVLAALKRNEVVCLLCDRDISGDGIEVDFMGERTTLPAGPALLSLRSGAPIMPAAVYFTDGGGHFAVERPAMFPERQGKLREDVARVTQHIADDLGLLIAAAPQQWHLFGPNWPSDLH